jgi:hypothetical protein
MNMPLVLLNLRRRAGALVVSGVNTVAPYIDSSFYGQAWYELDDGVWTGTPTFTYDLEVSTDGSTGWASITAAWLTSTAYTVGMRVTNGGSTYTCLVDHTSGTFATDLTAAKWLVLAVSDLPAFGNLPKGQLDSKYVRAKVTPSLGSAAYSPAYLVRPSYSHVLRFNPANTGVAANIDRAISNPFLGYELTTGGIWMQGFVYWDGTNALNNIMGLGNVAAASTHLSLSGNAMAVVSTSTYSASLSAVATAQAGWYLVTGRVWKVGGTVFQQIWRNELASAIGSQTLGLTLATSGYTALRLGNRANNSTNLAIKSRSCAFSVGTGDPSLFHAWVYNDGQYRNPLDYDFGADALGASIGFHERGYRVGAATWTTADGIDEIGTLDTVTNTGGSVPSWDAPTSVLPPFIKALGPDPVVDVGFISPQYVFAGTQQSFQYNNAVGKIVEGALTASPWVTATSYAIGARVTQGGSTYICFVAHTSGTFATDLTAVKWKIYSITSLTHTGWPVGSLHCPEGSTGLGNITGTITNGIFTCNTPGELSASVNIGGATITMTSAIYPDVAMPAAPRDATKFNGNGLVAAFEPYPSVGAGTTYANAAALASAIGSMTAGATLIVENLADASNDLTIPARDYGGATVVCRNLYGVDVKDIFAAGVQNLTIRGFECVGKIYSGTGATGVAGMWVDHCKAAQIALRGISGASSILRLTNFQTVETGIVNESSLNDFKTAIVLRCAWGDTTADNLGDIMRVDRTERHIVKRVYVGDNGAVNPDSHPDCWQVYAAGANGFNCGVYEDMVIIDQGGDRPAQGLFINNAFWRGLYVNRCAVSVVATNSIAVKQAYWNVVLTNNSATGALSVNGGFANAPFAKNNVRGSAGNVLTIPGTELDTKSLSTLGISTTTVWPQWNTYPLSWRKWANPATGYTDSGAYAFIAELEAKRVALGI